MRIVALLIAASVTAAAAPAYAGPCSKEIEMVSQLLGGGGASMSNLGGAASAAPSTSTLSAVTGGSGAGAPAASPEAIQSVEQAKKADAAGDETSCMDYINKAKELLGLIQ